MDKPIIALMYDFDNTLSVKNMQDYSFIPSLGYDSGTFWKKCNEFKDKYSMDQILAYMYFMVDEAKKRNIKITEENLNEMGKNITFFKGVESWFGRINKYGDKKGFDVKHYIISSGLKEIIAGSKIFNCFDQVYAARFLYGENGEAIWPAVSINYTQKTQYIYRINKGVESETDDKNLNEHMDESQKKVPFNRMIYFGDGMTDVPSMKSVKLGGGYSIAVYNDEDEKNMYTVDKLMEYNRCDFACRSDYSEDSPLEKVVFTIIDKIASEYEYGELKNEYTKAESGIDQLVFDISN